MIDTTAVGVVLRWQAAANEHNIADLLELSDPVIELVGPRGVAQGHQVLAAWVERAGAKFTNLRLFARADRVVVLQHGRWYAPETGELQGEAEVATAFSINQGYVQRIARFDTLSLALHDAQLTLDDEHAVQKQVEEE